MRLKAPPPGPADQTADLKLRFRGAPSGIPAGNHQRAARFSLLVRLGTDFSAFPFTETATSSPIGDESAGRGGRSFVGEGGGLRFSRAGERVIWGMAVATSN
jgi:hypothetical protein